MFFDTFDRTGQAEFPFPKQVVFRALCEAVAGLPGTTVQSEDRLACRIEVGTAISLFSWGSACRFPSPIGPTTHPWYPSSRGRRRSLAQQRPHGKNRQNVRAILEATSALLQERGTEWCEEMGLTAAPSTTSSVADELVNSRACAIKASSTRPNSKRKKREFSPDRNLRERVARKIFLAHHWAMNWQIEELKFAVEEWTADGNHITEVLARVSNVSVALAAFEAATRVRPRGPVSRFVRVSRHRKPPRDTLRPLRGRLLCPHISADRAIAP